ncbi:MAG: hypothetical protein ABEJ71_00160, partial [Halodesulfurarchaeum sp.]
MEVPVRRSRRLEEYWSWVAVALFLLLTVDLLTTMFAAHVVGPAAEANPLVRWAMVRGGIAMLLALNLAALALLVILFYGLIRLTREAPAPYDDVVALVFEVWIGLLVALGLLIFANNLLVIVHGEDIFSLLSL